MSTQLYPSCPIRTTLELLGGKWRLLILDALAKGPQRFGKVRQQLPEISEKMLAQELGVLVDSGLVQRHDYEEVPPRVEYQLTDWGRKALPLQQHMRDFGLAYQQALREAAAQELNDA